MSGALRALGAALLLCACGGAVWEPAEGAPEDPPPPVPGKAPNPAPADGSFAATRDRLVDQWLALTPSWGRDAGLHRYDGKVADYRPQGIARYRRWLAGADRALGAFDPATLPTEEALDLAVLRSRVALERFTVDEMATPETQPLFYAELFDVSGYLVFDYAPLEWRMRELVSHERAALRQVEHVLSNLRPTLSRPIVETAIGVFEGYRDYLRQDVPRALAQVADPLLRQSFEQSNTALAEHAATIARALRAQFLPRADNTSHVLGPKRYLAFVAAQEGLTVDLADFERMAEEDLAKNQRAYLELSRRTRPTRPDKDQLFAAASEMVEASRAFLVEKQLVTIPSDERCVVRETPPFMRWNAAFLNMPGPFDRAKQAYYYITPPNPAWPEDQQREYVFPHGVLRATTVHEVWPGHFLQGLWQRRAPTRVQRLIDSYSFGEGWAHYVEQMMIEEGFGAADPQSRLGQLSDALLRNCRFVVSIGVHAHGMSLDEAAKRFREDCMQDAASAEQQAVRATFDPGYFAYTLGKLQILELREELKRELGARFDLRRFHDAMLAHGSPPIALIRDRVAEAVRSGG